MLNHLWRVPSAACICTHNNSAAISSPKGLSPQAIPAAFFTLVVEKVKSVLFFSGLLPQLRCRENAVSRTTGGLQIAEMIRVHAKPRKYNLVLSLTAGSTTSSFKHHVSLPKIRTCVAPSYKAILVDKWQKKLLLHCESDGNMCGTSHGSSNVSKLKFFETKTTSKPHSLGYDNEIGMS